MFGRIREERIGLSPVPNIRFAFYPKINIGYLLWLLTVIKRKRGKYYSFWSLSKAYEDKQMHLILVFHYSDHFISSALIRK